MQEQTPRVLVVDDERFFREAIQEVLSGDGLEAVLVEDGESALGAAADSAVGVVVLDIRLPGIDGIEVLRRLRSLRPELRVIMLSASTDQELVLDALRLGACDYLAKPLHEEELLLAVRRAWESYSVATDWTRLRGRLDRLVARMEDLASQARAGGDPETRALRQLAAEAAAEVLEAGKTSLMLLNEEGTQLSVAASHGRSLAADEMDPVAVGEGVAGVAFERSEPIVVSNVDEDERFGPRPSRGQYDSGSFAVAPLASGDRPLGVLCATDRRGGEGFGTDDLSLLRLLAMQISGIMALGRADLRAGEAAPAEDPGSTAVLGEVAAESFEVDPDAELARLVCDAVVTEVEPERVIQAALAPLAARLPAAPASLYLIDAPSGDLRRAGECDGGARSDRELLSCKRGLTGTVFQTGHLVATDEPESDARFDADVDTPQDGVPGPMLCLPLHFRGKIVGIFRAFPLAGATASARSGEVLAAVLSAAVRNVLLYRSLVETIEEVAEARREASQTPTPRGSQ